MADVTERQIVEDVSRDIVRELRPGEMITFRAVSEAFFQQGEKSIVRPGSQDSALGFGGGGLDPMLTPFVLAMTQEAVKLLVVEVGKSAAKQSAPFVLEWVKGWFVCFGAAKAADGPPPLTQEQLKRVRDASLATGRRLGLAEDRAELLADALVGNLTVAS